MLFCRPGIFGKRGVVSRLPVSLVIALGAVLHQTSWCQAPDTATMVPVQQNEWILGQTNIPVADCLQVELPLGYRFGFAPLAERYLAQDGNMVPCNLAGLIDSRHGKIAIISFTPMEHITIDSASEINADVALKNLRTIAKRQNETGKVRLKGLDWISPPAYDSQRQLIRWTVLVEVEAPNGAVVKFENQTARILGRRGVLDITTAGPQSALASTVLPLEEAIAIVQFRPGDRYIDAASGDKAQTLTLTEIAAMDTEGIAAKAAAANGKWALFLWVAIGCLAAIGTTLLVVKMRHARPAPRSALSSRRSAEESNPTREPVFARTIAAARNAAPSIAAPAGGNGNADAKTNGNGKTVKPQNGQRLVKTNGHSSRSRQRRDFDYNRYFTDLMSSVSGHMGYAKDADVASRTANTSASNGQNTAPASTTSGQSSASSLDVHAQMISNQRALIEEQRRLIYEQTKLIEEKSKLIAEKNQLLDRQTELLDNKLL
jgi:uncharacterized membrane-anchored protein